MDNNEIIKNMITWSMEVVEKPTAAFGGLPICPFAKKARLENKIRWEVLRFEINGDVKNIIDLLNSFNPKVHDIMIIVNPENTSTPKSFFDFIDTTLRPQAQDIGLDFLGAHPDDLWEIAGHRTIWPYPCFLISTMELLGKSSNKLLKSRYYDLWSQSNLDYFGIPRKSKHI